MGHLQDWVSSVFFLSLGLAKFEYCDFFLVGINQSLLWGGGCVHQSVGHLQDRVSQSVGNFPDWVSL